MRRFCCVRNLALTIACAALTVACGLPAAGPGAALAQKGHASKAASFNPISGPLQIMISLAEQQLVVYAGGIPVSSTRISSGQAGYATPTGVFSIIEKQRYHESNIYSGAPMPFMQRLTWSGIALHEGHVPRYRASHGCIRLPAAFAAELFGITRRGDRVIVSEGRLVPQPIEHTALFLPRPLPVEEQVALETAEDDMREPDAKRPSRSAPISLLISRKTGKLYLRRGFQQVFDADVTIADPDRYIGTHVFMAMGPTGEGEAMRWTVVTTTPDRPPPPRRSRTERKQQIASLADPVAPAEQPPATASNALDRIEIPSDVVGAIGRWLTPGASLIITDQGLGPETQPELGTDFIVLGP